MIAFTVFSLLVPFAVVALLILLAVRSNETSSGADPGGGGQAGGDGGPGIRPQPDVPRQPDGTGTPPADGPQETEPDWWPEFEREFADYAARVKRVRVPD